MALVARDSQASMDTSQIIFAPQISGLLAGENLDPVAPCYVKAADGKVYMSNGTAANEAAKFDGFTPRAVVAGRPVTLFGVGARARYATTGVLTPGANLYIGATAGRLDTVATVGGTVPVARAIDDTDIRVLVNSLG
jgi:hypothetical protein